MALLVYFCTMQVETELFSEEQSESLYERKTFVVDPGQEPYRIDKWIQMHLEGATRNKIQQAI